MFDHFGRVPRQFRKMNEIGFLAANDFCGMVMRVQGQWFTLNENIDLHAIARDCFLPGLFEEIMAKYHQGTSVVSRATTRQETEPYNQPVTLEIVR